MEKIDLAKLSESELVELFIEKQADAVFKEIYTRYYQMVYGYMRKVAYYVSEAIIEELSDDVFMNIYQHAVELRDLTGFKRWVYQIAHNVCVNHIKKRRETRLEDEKLESVQDKRVNIEADHIREELQKSVQEEIGRFDPLKREIIILKFYQDLTHEEISGVMKISVRKVKYELKKALLVLHQRLKWQELPL